MINKIPLECMDCASDVLFDQIADGIYQVTIAHDDTCPWFAQREREHS